MIDSLINVNYSPAVDICTMITCLLLCCMLLCSYTPKSENLIVFVHAVVGLFLACTFRITAQILCANISRNLVIPIYIFRDLAYAMLMMELVLVCVYLRNLVSIEESRKRRFTIYIWSVAVITIILDVLSPLTGTGFYIDQDLHFHQDSLFNYFRIGYGIFLITLIIVLIMHRRRFIQRMYWSFWIIMFFVCAIFAMQGMAGSSSFTCITFLFPMLAVMFMFHFNSYDTKTGMLEARTFDSYIHEMENTQTTMIFVYLKNAYSNILDNMSEELFNFDRKYLVDSVMFRLRDDKICLIYEQKKNPDAPKRLPEMIQEFDRLYDKYRIDFKVVLIHSSPEIENGKEYRQFDIFLEKELPINEVYVSVPEDINRYKTNRYILAELYDIYNKKDMNDKRVLVYVQPVYNVEKKCFDTAEALMRLELPEIGIVQPDDFISLAEKNEYIHVLSLIMLNKTCKAIKKLLEQGFKLERISVNVAIEELMLDGFSDEVTLIIKKNGLRYEQVALEITESQKESDFGRIKSVIQRLHNAGIKFYLDDFGTSYSNLERILGLPVDIVKFDKSMLKLATKDENSKTFARTMSEMFQTLYFRVLFEGVETENDEMECIEMFAQYLQGFKYSKPIPIEELGGFLDK